ncbi:MAG: hypothetical protein ACLUI3_02665 [Christensenellales bacterium]
MRLTKPKIALFAALLFYRLRVLPPTREGAKLLVNDLFALSESVNAYVMNGFPLRQTPAACPPASCSARRRPLCRFRRAQSSRLPALTAALILAATQAYFGLSLPAPVNVLLFALPG